jgi:hypothetical protein
MKDIVHGSRQSSREHSLVPLKTDSKQVSRSHGVKMRLGYGESRALYPQPHSGVMGRVSEPVQIVGVMN